MPGRTLRLWPITVAVAVVLCLAFLGGRSLLYYVCRHYSRANTVIADFDYAGGRVRVRKYFLWVKLRESIDETHHTAFYRELIGEPPPPVWGRAYSVPYVARFGGFYGDGSYGGALLWARDEEWWDFLQGGLSPEAAKPCLLQYLTLLADADKGGADPDRWRHVLTMVIVFRKELGMPPLGAEDLSVSRLEEQFGSLVRLREDRKANKPPSE